MMTRPRTAPAVLVALAAVVVYAVMWVGYCQQWGWLHRFDWSLLNAAHDEHTERFGDRDHGGAVGGLVRVAVNAPGGAVGG